MSRANSRNDNGVVIHHLTDVHIGPLHHKASQKLPYDFGSHATAGWENLSYYLKYLRADSRKAEQLHVPDFLIVSGDLTSVGSEQEFNRAKDALREIIAIVKSKKSSPRKKREPCLFLVPGNHDLDWSQESREKKFERFGRLCDDLPDHDVVSPFYHKARSPSPVFHVSNSCNLLIYLFNTCPLGATKDLQIARLRDSFEKLHHAKDAAFESALKELEKLSRKDPGYIEPDALEELERLPETHDNRLKIAVMHHNPSGVPNNDIEEFDTIINAGLVKDKLLKQGFDLVLHGHRHHAHCSYEEYLKPIGHAEGTLNRWKMLPYQQGIFILGGAPLGTEKDCAFFEIRILDSDNVHKEGPPSSLVNVSLASRSGSAEYEFQDKYRIIIDKPTTAQLRWIQEQMGSTVLGRTVKQQDLVDLRPVLKTIGPPVRRLQALVDAWDNEHGIDWLKAFHTFLPSFSFVAATDCLGAATWLNPNYLHHVAKQIRSRQQRSLNDGSTILRFSDFTLEAIRRTRWDPNYYKTAGEPTRTLELRQKVDNELEIVRILFWGVDELKESAIVEFVDFYHALAAIPVFVLDPNDLKQAGGLPPDIGEFILGINQAGIVTHPFGMKANGHVEMLENEFGPQLLNVFKRLLKNPALKTLQAIAKPPKKGVLGS
ncbi:MAG TPA: metallophosphoesterase [Gemmataceae bacterium]|jgi:3',5'-cyclic AMP phosphodiesterase CpdA|nr:metallophosphoesterase [Gemmataceae bacterium]